MDGRVGEVAEQNVFWTYDRVVERLIETVRCWWRMPGGGHWPFASDGPWHLVKSELYGPDVDRDAPVRALPLRRAEIAAMNEATEWITWVSEEKRIALVFGIAKQAAGATQIPWGRLRRRLGTVGTGGLDWRYDKAVELIANVLNAMAGVKYVSRKGAVAAYPKAVREIVERVKSLKSGAGNVSSPVICS